VKKLMVIAVACVAALAGPAKAEAIDMEGLRAAVEPVMNAWATCLGTDVESNLRLGMDPHQALDVAFNICSDVEMAMEEVVRIYSGEMAAVVVPVFREMMKQSARDTLKETLAK
jgi:hypothetical protein